ncbi:MAG: ABC transporter substrate-binding protein [Mycobacteriaceae bacterium]
MKLGRHRRRGLAVAVAATMLLSACGVGSSDSKSSGGAAASGDANTASDVGVTATSVSIGTHMPLTGVASPGYSEIPKGSKAYYDYVNAAGGVNKRKIDYKVLDDTYNPATTSQVVNQLVLQDKVFAIVGGLGTPTHSAVLDFLNSQGVPDLFVSSGSLLWNQPKKNPETFGWQPDYEIEAKILGQYVKQNFPKAKVGLFLQDDDLGVAGEKGAREYLGDQIVSVAKYVSGNTDVGPQIAQLQASGADLVIGFNVPSYTALSQLTAGALNYKPQWIYSNIGSDPGLVGSLLKKFSKGKVSGDSPLTDVITTQYMPQNTDTDNPWTQLWNKVWKANGTGGPLTNFEIYGMAEAYSFVQSLQAAGKNPTRESIVKAVQDQGAKFEGPNFVPFRFSADNHSGIGGLEVVKLAADGSAKPVTKVLQTGNDKTDITPYDGKIFTPPASGIPDVKPAG